MGFEQCYHPVQVSVFHSRTTDPSHVSQPAAVQLHSVHCEIDLNVDSIPPYTKQYTHQKTQKQNIENPKSYSHHHKLCTN